MRKAKPVLCLILAAVLLLSLAACQKAEELPEGYYVLRENQTETTYEQTPFLLFKEDGTAVLFNGTELWDCSWLHGRLKLMGGGAMEYTVEGNDLTLGTGDGILRFRKSKEQAPDPEQLKEDLSMPAETGYYQMTKIVFNEDSVTMTAEELEVQWYLALYEDKTAVSCMAGELCADLLWEDGELTDPEGEDDPVRYTLEDEELIAEDSYMTVYFTRTSRTAPDPETLHEMGIPAEVGYYILTSMTLDGMVLGQGDLENIYEVLPFLLLQEDGSAILYSGSSIEELSWEDGTLYDEENGTEGSYELEGDTLTATDDDYSLVFERSQEDVPDLESLPVAGQDLTGNYELYSYDMGQGEKYDCQAELALYKDGTGLYSTGETSYESSWSDESITIIEVEYTYEVDENGWLLLEGSDGSFTFRPISEETPEMDLWNNDWYGWWVVDDCTGEFEQMEDAWWDMCARSTVSEDGTGTIRLWDEDGSLDHPLGEVTFTLDGNPGSDILRSQEGYFYKHQLGPDDWVCDPSVSHYENMAEISGVCSTETGSYTYRIYLRPWGQRWEDTDEFYVPYHYEDWYLPLVEAGEPMPEEIVTE